jgi:predicted RNA-binding Zn ribbon-like protein
MPREPVDRPAPGRLELVRAFVNTLDLDKSTDSLTDPRAAATWLVAAELLPAGSRVAQGALPRISQVRQAFRTVLVANAEGGRADEAVEVLNEVARDANIVMRLSGPGSANPVVTAGGVEGALGQLVAIALEAIGDGTWTRLKACPASTCHWAFYDTSRNRSSRWCDMAVCGNRAKRETFRSRGRTGDRAPEPDEFVPAPDGVRRQP